MQDQSTVPTVLCDHCGGPVPPRPPHHTGRGQHTYCSRQCGTASHRLDRVAWFRARVVTSADPSQCHPFQGLRDSDGYGRFSIRQDGQVVSRRAHRFAYELEHGPGAADGQQVQHLCNNPPCCNPAHLVVGDTAQNAAYMAASGRATAGERHWARAHPERIPRGERTNVNKVNSAEVLAIRAACATRTESFAIIGRRYGITATTVWMIYRRKTWKHVP